MKPLVVAAKIDRQPNEPLPNQELNILVDGNNQFAFSLYRVLNDENSRGNLVFSPHSIALALAMTYGGARGETALEMKQALHINLPDVQFHQAWNSLDQWLRSQPEDQSNREEGYKLRMTNAIWAQQDYPFLGTYLDLLAAYYGAGIQTTDFSRFPEESRSVINQWVADQTEQKITDLIPPGAIHPLTRMALVNAIYLNAPWRQPFDEQFTSDRLFYLADGSEVLVPFMYQTQNVQYYADDAIQMVELPYSGGQLSMVIVMPAAGTYQQFSGQLDAESFKAIMSEESFGEIKIKLPRFRIEDDFNLNEKLEKLGINNAFNPDQADFSGMEPGRELYIDQVIHKAYIDVNEAGTEAAAATAVLMAGKGFNPEEPKEITFDHPFLFIIHDRETNAILFIGQVMNPAS